MAYKVPVSEIKERFSRFLRYTVRLAPIVVIVGAFAWFFLLRSPDGQTNTGVNETSETNPETVANAAPEAKASDNAKSAEPAKEEGKAAGGKLPETGPADTLALFATTTIAGTLLHKWLTRTGKRQDM